VKTLAKKGRIKCGELKSRGGKRWEMGGLDEEKRGSNTGQTGRRKEN